MVLLLPLFWAPGLLGLLTWLGLPGAVAGAVLEAGVVLMALSAVLNARGTWHAREHVRDIAPGAVVTLSLALALGAVR